MMRGRRWFKTAVKQRRGDGGLHHQHLARSGIHGVISQREARRERLDQPVPHRVLHGRTSLGPRQLVVRSTPDRGQVHHHVAVVGQIRAMQAPHEQVRSQWIRLQVRIGAQESIVDASVGGRGWRAARGQQQGRKDRAGTPVHRTTSTGRSA